MANATKTAAGLVDYAKAQLGLPYWYGTFGHTATEALYEYNKGRFPLYYQDNDFKSQIGKRVHDCIGLIKGYIWSETPTSQPKYVSNGCPDHSANSMLAACVTNGNIATMPDIPGTLVFMPDHVGVYIGDGNVIEARGHRFGVVQTRLKSRGWKNWGLCPYINYDTEEDDMAKVIEQIAAAAGMTVDATINALGVLARGANTTVEPWEAEGAKFLVDSKLCDTLHAGNETVEYGELGVMFRRHIGQNPAK